MLSTAQKNAFAETIENRNPYTFLNADHPGMALAPDWFLHVEEDGAGYDNAGVFFRGVARQIQKMVRIPYTYQDAHGNVVEEHLLVVYEGSSSD